MRIRMLRLQRRILISGIIIALTLFIIIHVFHIDPRKGEGPRHIHTYGHSRLSHTLGELEQMENNNKTRNTKPDQKLVHPEIQPLERNSNNNNADVQQNVSSRSNTIISQANMKPTDIVLDARKLSEHQTKHTGKTLTQLERNVTKPNKTVVQAQATVSDVQEPVTKGEVASPLKKVSSSSSSTTTTPATKDVSAECLPQEDPSDIKTSFKFYIYNLPAKFNSDIQHFMSTDKSHAHCYSLYHCGMGEELMEYSYNQGMQLSPNPFHKYLRFNRATIDINGEKINNNTYYKVSLRNTQQFALETIIHYKLLHSPYRTNDPNKADAFYIPAYTGLTCLGYYDNAAEKIHDLFKYLKTNQSKFFNSGKPHFSTISKIQREQGTEHCPTLREVSPTNITWIAIEKESNPFWSKYQHISHQSIIVAPYPSYVHFSNTRHDQYLLEQAHGSLADLSKTQFVLDYVPPISERDVFLFMAAGTRRSNLFRANIIDQFAVQTDLSYEEYFSNKANKAGLLISAQKPASDNRTAGHCIMLKTVECEKRHRYTTIPWMMKSVFCLNPPGDSPTRKSFYDSILSGCIPVIFSEKYNTTYPFHHRLEYNTFTVTIQEYLVSKENQKVVDILAKISAEKIAELHTNLLKVAKWFQYSVPDGRIQTDDDAMTLIMADLQQVFHFNLDHR